MDIKYIKFLEGEQKKFLRLAKSRLSITGVEMAKRLSVSRSMVYRYLNGSCKLPFNSFILLCEVSEIDSKSFEFRIETIISKGEPVLPKSITPQFAEFIGILLGDGCISLTKYGIYVSLDSVLDKPYLESVVERYFLELFRKTPSVYYSNSSRNVRCFIYSKEVFNFLTNKIGLPYGKRKYNPRNRIPKVISSDNKLLSNAIRGLFDTEGGFYQHNRTSPRLYIYNTSKYLLGSIYEGLLQLGYTPTLKKDAVKICKKQEIVKFFNQVGSNNPQKLLKYRIWLREGTVPKNSRVIEEFRRW